MTVRAGRQGDLQAIADIYNHFIRATAISFHYRPVDLDERRRWFAEFADDGPHRLLVAEDGGAGVVGFASSAPFGKKEAYRSSVEVTVYAGPADARRGVGTALYGALIAAIGAAGIHRAYALIAKPNPASEAFHARFGFREVGVLAEVGYKFDRYWDVGYWELRL